MPPRNTVLHLSTHYTDPIPSNSSPFDTKTLVSFGEYNKTYYEQENRQNAFVWNSVMAIPDEAVWSTASQQQLGYLNMFALLHSVPVAYQTVGRPWRFGGAAYLLLVDIF